VSHPPINFDFIGSISTVAVWTWSHVPHSNVLISNPDGPGAIRANIMRDVQCEHRGRSIGVSDGPKEK
jgi:hypothetical protein